jgi:hypothetical protein
VSIFTKRNAIVGFTAMQILKRRRAQRRNRRALKVAAFVALGLVSAGVLAGLVAVALRRQREGDEGVAGDSDELLEESSADDSFGATLPEPGFAA